MVQKGQVRMYFISHNGIAIHINKTACYVGIFISNFESNDRFIYKYGDIQSPFLYSYQITMVLSIIYV